MTLFVDTSALFAVLAAEDENHHAAADWLGGPGRSGGEALLTHNYVVLESASLVQRRLGTEAVRALFHDLLPVIAVVYVDESIHRNAVGVFLALAGRTVSLVDCVSFAVMRASGIRRAFAFDRDFREQGFETVP